ncbi:hypothetical protein AGMMS50229_05710 [Campylobacterota bacterium]|nr:hypothetical protein AGMMS50229_05710 [Campylobacterota bacterium]
MLRFLLLLFACFCVANAVNIKEIKTTATGDKVEIALLFDAQFTGKVTNQRDGDLLLILIQEAAIDAPRIFTPKSDLIAAIRVTPKEGATQIAITQKTRLDSSVETSGGNLELRLSFAKGAASATTAIGASRMDMTESYIYMFLFISLLLLLWLLVKIVKSRQNSSWLMGKNKIDTIQIIQQKPIDAKNKIVQISLRGVSYLLLIGNSSFYIDRVDENSSGGAFSEILKANESKLNEYMAKKRS